MDLRSGLGTGSEQAVCCGATGSGSGVRQGQMPIVAPHLVVLPSTRNLALLGLSLLSCKMGLIMPTPLRCSEEEEEDDCRFM